jgi:isopentenyl diphosphate isomerase/L-lactate dehydrogenase-like FMN-dependent dehydrogenase
LAFGDTLCGLAIAGEVGVCDVVKNLLVEFEFTMGLSGCGAIAEISRTCLQQSN